ncbi:MAG: SDR family oxidoreductase [Spirochaetales bacterium]|nr:SDR family oxidoreductase [Spirochaetales bacterium]
MEYRFGLSGKKAVVTGASRGIGFGIAEALASEGVEVAIGARHLEGASEAARSLEAKHGVRCFPLGIDVRSADSVTEAFDTLEREFGALDIAVNNAGVASNVDFLSMQDSDWDNVFETNLKGVYRCCKREIPLMSARGGSIVNIASISGVAVNTPQLQAHYNTSKAGLIMLSRSLAFEYARSGIRVNVVSPGYTLTEMNKREEILDMIETWKKLIPMGRLAEVREMCGPVLFLVSDLASYITGHNLIVDGGYTIL